jgi:hypothetical protein
MQEIVLSRGKVTMVDDRDYEFLNQWKWYAGSNTWSGDFYATRKATVSGKRMNLYMARVITDAPPGKVVDHINHDTLDNRRENLRVCGQKVNLLNRKGDRGSTSKYKGVSLYRPTGMWAAYFRGEYIAYFKCEADAAQAYNARVKECGVADVAILNDIPGRGKPTHYPPAYNLLVNTSKYRGVSWHKNKKVWFSSITIDGERHFLGIFKKEEDAAEAFDAACDEYGVPERKNNGQG